MKEFFDYIGRAITSLSAVIFVMLMTITGMVLFSHTLFTNVFPDGMQPWEKLSATWFMALGWEFTVLITTCNVKHIHRHIPVVMAVCSGIIVLFFIQAFDGEQSSLTIIQRWFVGILAATINYIYAELFYKKWSERNDFIKLPSLVIELQSKLNESESKAIHSSNALIEERKTTDQLRKQVKEFERLKEKIQSDVTCPYCNTIQDSPNSLRVHKGHCSSNPRKQLKP